MDQNKLPVIGLNVGVDDEFNIVSLVPTSQDPAAQLEFGATPVPENVVLPIPLLVAIAILGAYPQEVSQTGQG